jgi:hypothetical protein
LLLHKVRTLNYFVPFVGFNSKEVQNRSAEIVERRGRPRRCAGMSGEERVWWQRE